MCAKEAISVPNENGAARLSWSRLRRVRVTNRLKAYYNGIRGESRRHARFRAKHGDYIQTASTLAKPRAVSGSAMLGGQAVEHKLTGYSPLMPHSSARACIWAFLLSLLPWSFAFTFQIASYLARESANRHWSNAMLDVHVKQRSETDDTGAGGWMTDLASDWQWPDGRIAWHPAMLAQPTTMIGRATIGRPTHDRSPTENDACKSDISAFGANFAISNFVISPYIIMAWTFPCFPYSYRNTAFSQSKLTFSKRYFIIQYIQQACCGFCFRFFVFEYWTKARKIITVYQTFACILYVVDCCNVADLL